MVPARPRVEVPCPGHDPLPLEALVEPVGGSEGVRPQRESGSPCSTESTVNFTTQPPTVVCKMEAQLEYIHTAHTFLRLLTKFLHRSSGGSLLRVRCWLGSEVQVGCRRSLRHVYDSFEHMESRLCRLCLVQKPFQHRLKQLQWNFDLGKHRFSKGFTAYQLARTTFQLSRGLELSELFICQKIHCTFRTVPVARRA